MGSMIRALSLLGLAVLGGLIGLMGTVSHRSLGYVGLVIALAAIASSSLLAKAWQGWWGFAAYATGWAATVMALAQVGPGGSVLIAGDLKGQIWVYGGAAVVALVAMIPPFVLTGRDVRS